MAARVTLKAVNDELARRGHHARLEKGSGYFYFWSEDSADWIDRTVRVATLKSLTLDQWVGEYLWLKKVNAEMIKPRRKGPWICLADPPTLPGSMLESRGGWSVQTFGAGCCSLPAPHYAATQSRVHQMNPRSIPREGP
jgi:hypothetical protein